MITSTVSSKGQVTIPKKIREFLELETFDKVVFIPLEEGKVMITNKQIPVSDLFGMLKHRKPKQPVSWNLYDHSCVYLLAYPESKKGQLHHNV